MYDKRLEGIVPLTDGGDAKLAELGVVVGGRAGLAYQGFVVLGSRFPAFGGGFWHTECVCGRLIMICIIFKSVL